MEAYCCTVLYMFFRALEKMNKSFFFPFVVVAKVFLPHTSYHNR